METSYRLDEYKIIEAGINEIRWEVHFGLGAFQKGKCFRKGKILFIGPMENTNAGFLKGEFLDHIDKLPFWSKTPYYCKGCEVYHCNTSNRVSKEEMLSWMLERKNGEHVRFNSEQSEKSLDQSPVTEECPELAFRLQRYKIVKKATGEVCWITHAGPNLGVRGNCIVLEDILFIKSFQSEPSELNKRSFQANLRQLPRWNQTRYYSQKLSLLDSKSGCRILSTEKRQEKKLSGEKKQGTKIRKKVAKVTITETSEKKNFSERIFNTLNSISQSKETVSSRAGSLWSKFKKPNIPKRIAKIRITRFWRWITSTIILIVLIIIFLFTFLIGVWNEHREKSHHKRSKHSSNYHRDH